MDSEASSSSSSSGQQAMPSLSSHWRAFFRLWRPKSMRRLVTFPPVGVPKLAKWRTSREGKQAAPSDPVEADLSLFRPSWMSFSISELQDATDNFNSDLISSYAMQWDFHLLWILAELNHVASTAWEVAQIIRRLDISTTS